MPLASLTRLCVFALLAFLIADVPARAGGPTFHLAAARHALDRIQDPELRALLRIDEIVEWNTPWDQADHYATIRFAEAGGRLFLFGRAYDGLQTWMLEANGIWRKVSSASPAFSDTSGWNQPQYYETFRVETIGSDIYFLGRGANAVGLSRLDTKTLQWHALPALNALSTFNNVEHYSTLRTEVVGQNLYLFARGVAAVAAYVFETATETWRALPTIVSLTDAGGFDQEQYYSTIRTETVGNIIYLFARAHAGIVTLRFDTTSETWLSVLPVYQVMTTQSGWSQPQYYATLRTEVVGQDIYLLGRASAAVVAHRFATATQSWQALPSIGELTDAGGWDAPQYYATIRTEVVGNVLYLLARASSGILTLRFDTVTSAWMPSLPIHAELTNAGGWDAGPWYYTTLRTQVLGNQLYLIARGGARVVTLVLETSTGAWQSGASVNPPWNNGGFDANGRYDVDTYIDPITGPSASLIYMAYQNGALLPDIFNNYGAGAFVDQDPHLAEFLWEYSKYVLNHRQDALVVANFLGCLAHVVGDFRLDRFFLAKTERTCSVNAQFSAPWNAPPYSYGVQSYVDIWLDNHFAPTFRPSSGYPYAAIQFPTPQVWAPSYVPTLLANAYPQRNQTATINDIESALALGWSYTILQTPLARWSSTSFAVCPEAEALSTFEFAVGGVRDSGEAIADYFDDCWAILKSGKTPRFEKGNQGNQRSAPALSAGRLGHVALTDFAVGVDRGDPRFSAYTAARPDPRFGIDLQTDKVSWHRVQSEVEQYEMLEDLMVALIVTSGGSSLRASKGFLDASWPSSSWTEWLPAQLAGSRVKRFAMEQVAPGSNELRVAVLLTDGTLHAFDRHLDQPTAPSPAPTLLGTGTMAFQLDGDRIAWLSGGQLWVQEGLLGATSAVRSGVSAFQLEGARTAALVGGVLQIQEGPGQPWVSELQNVRAFELSESLSAALSVDGTLRARWGWSATEANGTGWLTNALLWHTGPEYYATIRTQVVGNDLYLFARGSTGVEAYKLDGSSQTWQALPSISAWDDGGGWNAERYYSTIRIEAVGRIIYLFARGSTGIVTLRFDTATSSWLSSPPILQALSDAGGWGAGPEYYSTLRTEVVGSAIYLFGRGGAAIPAYRFDTLAQSWQALPTTPQWTDAAGWDQPQYYATIRSVVVGSVVHLLARASSGIAHLRFDTQASAWLPAVPAYPVMTDASGWDDAEHYQTLRAEVVGTEVYLMGRSGGGIVTHVLDTLTGSWSALPSYGVLRDDENWDEAPYYSEHRTAVVGGSIYYFARASCGVAVYALDTSTRAWRPISLGWPYWTDFGGWAAPQHHTTLRVEVIGSQLHLLGRHSKGIQSFALETGPSPWRILSRNVSHFDLEGNFLAVDAPPIAPPSSLPGAVSVVPTFPRTVHVAQLGTIPSTLGAAAQWTWSPLLTRSDVEEFHFGGGTQNRSARGFFWLTTRLDDGTLIEFGHQGYLPRRTRRVLPVAKEQMPIYDSRVEVLVPPKSTPVEALADRRAVLIGGVLYVKDIE